MIAGTATELKSARARLDNWLDLTGPTGIERAPPIPARFRTVQENGPRPVRAAGSGTAGGEGGQEAEQALPQPWFRFLDGRVAGHHLADLHRPLRLVRDEGPDQVPGPGIGTLPSWITWRTRRSPLPRPRTVSWGRAATTRWPRAWSSGSAGRSTSGWTPGSPCAASQHRPGPAGYRRSSAPGRWYAAWGRPPSWCSRGYQYQRHISQHGQPRPDPACCPHMGGRRRRKCRLRTAALSISSDPARP